jgi:Fis family transcriptional regulator
MDSAAPHTAPPGTQAPNAAGTAGHSIGDCVAGSVRRYLVALNGTPCPRGLYAKLLREIEPPLLQEVLAWSGGNQSRAAAILGIHRATLRKKLREFGID